MGLKKLCTRFPNVSHSIFVIRSEVQKLAIVGYVSGFHEAVSEAVGLSVHTPRHLHRIGLLNNITDDYGKDRCPLPSHHLTSL